MSHHHKFATNSLPSDYPVVPHAVYELPSRTHRKIPVKCSITDEESAFTTLRFIEKPILTGKLRARCILARRSESGGRSPTEGH